MEYRKYKRARYWRHLASAPFIWLPLPFLLALDLVIILYQAICFPLYGLDKVRRRDYILIRDRNKLAYLRPGEKINCMYCGYANGLMPYCQEIAARTEKYWCGVKHEGRPGFKSQPHQAAQDFANFGDEEAFREKYGR